MDYLHVVIEISQVSRNLLEKGKDQLVEKLPPVVYESTVENCEVVEGEDCSEQTHNYLEGVLLCINSSLIKDLLER